MSAIRGREQRLAYKARERSTDKAGERRPITRAYERARNREEQVRRDEQA